MLRKRLIPTLLIDSSGSLVKSRNFKTRCYIGDPLNAAYIFSEYKADEIVLLDIDSYREKKTISLDFVKEIAGFTDVPLAVGGGIRTLQQIESLLAAGAERVILGSILSENLDFLASATRSFGSSSISVIISYFGSRCLEKCAYFGYDFQSTVGKSLRGLAKVCESHGAGELIIYDVDRDGSRQGFDCELIDSLSSQLLIPLVVAGGCGKVSHVIDAFSTTSVSGLAIGSFFLFAQDTQEVLLSYPYNNSKSPLAHYCIEATHKYSITENLRA